MTHQVTWYTLCPLPIFAGPITYYGSQRFSPNIIICFMTAWLYQLGIPKLHINHKPFHQVDMKQNFLQTLTSRCLKSSITLQWIRLYRPDFFTVLSLFTNRSGYSTFIMVFSLYPPTAIATYQRMVSAVPLPSINLSLKLRYVVGTQEKLKMRCNCKLPCTEHIESNLQNVDSDRFNCRSIFQAAFI